MQVNASDVFSALTGLPVLILGCTWVFGPFLVGIYWIGPDADRRGQPGWIWELLTIPFGWITVIVYVALRALTA